MLLLWCEPSSRRSISSETPLTQQRSNLQAGFGYASCHRPIIRRRGQFRDGKGKTWLLSHYFASRVERYLHNFKRLSRRARSPMNDYLERGSTYHLCRGG